MSQKRKQFFPDPCLTSFCKYCIDFRMFYGLGLIPRDAPWKMLQIPFMNAQNGAVSVKLWPFLLKKPLCLGVAFLAGAFVFPEKRVLKKAMAPRRSVPSRGFFFPRKTCPEKIVFCMFFCISLRLHIFPWKGDGDRIFFAIQSKKIRGIQNRQ